MFILFSLVCGKKIFYRIHGTKVAEMPLIATRERYRSKGMCGKLMDAIESVSHFLMTIPMFHGNTCENGNSDRMALWLHTIFFSFC